jgi:tetratricopeptide (TPR) repeat protein
MRGRASMMRLVAAAPLALAPRCASRVVRLVAVAALALAAGCASRVVPPSLPSVVKYPEFVYPAVPDAMQKTPGAERVDFGWRYLQNDNLDAAEREFAAALKRSPQLYPARAGEAYTALARQRPEGALKAFDTVIETAPGYVPALVGRGQSLLALERDDEALRAFETALEADAALTDVRRRVELLRFQGLQQLIEAARADSAAGRLDTARTAYRRAIDASPESSFLHRELGLVLRKQGDSAAALAAFRRAVDLDAADVAALVQIAELLEGQQDFSGAEAAYLKAAAVEPSDELTARAAAVAEKAREARLPTEFRAIADATQVTRGDLAALIGVRLEKVIDAAPPRQIVVTDARNHWASAWITAVARAGVVETFANHTFQPRNRLRRADLAAAVSRVVTLIAARDPALRKRISERPKIADMSPGHLSYPAVAVAVTSGVLPLLEGQRFQVSRAVSGAEAIAAVDRLRALAADAP